MKVRGRIGKARPWEPEEALLLCYAGTRMGDAEFHDERGWWEPELDAGGLPPAFPLPVRSGARCYRFFLLPDGRIIQGGAAAAQELGISTVTLYKYAKQLDAKGRRIVNLPRRREAA